MYYAHFQNNNAKIAITCTMYIALTAGHSIIQSVATLFIWGTCLKTPSCSNVSAFIVDLTIKLSSHVSHGLTDLFKIVTLSFKIHFGYQFLRADTPIDRGIIILCECNGEPGMWLDMTSKHLLGSLIASDDSWITILLIGTSIQECKHTVYTCAQKWIKFIKFINYVTTLPSSTSAFDIHVYLPHVKTVHATAHSFCMEHSII